MKLIEYKETVSAGTTETKKVFKCTLAEVEHLCGVVGFGMYRDNRFGDYTITNQNGSFCGSFHGWDDSGVGTLDIWEV